ncbi:hypothetical protein GUJ93_ZPchr0005g15702 [Zizania palustris]|uniref:Glycoside hydrolase family 3 N-terminal domain-containing protein n=1 Tax=Zizania palustris TaxID=103762 RepID=A0A8J5W0T1_ZIZPA|nr:hypothetical protein GUJ93_ZPchr0005g15702 [Zizania palustris]
MAQIERTVALPHALAELGAGSVLNAGGRALHYGATAPPPTDWAGMVDMRRHGLSSRLAVPILFGTDAIHSHNNVFGASRQCATVFPHIAGLSTLQGFVVLDWKGIDRLCESTGSDYCYCIAQPINSGMNMIIIATAMESVIGNSAPWIHVLLLEIGGVGLPG